jgi:hypothetical protein
MSKYRHLCLGEEIKIGDSFQRKSGEWITFENENQLMFKGKPHAIKHGDLPVRRPVDNKGLGMAREREMMKNQVDYSQYRCPFDHIDKACGHELYGPEGYFDADGGDAYRVWCSCGFRGPAFSLDPEQLRLRKKKQAGIVAQHAVNFGKPIEISRADGTGVEYRIKVETEQPDEVVL